MKLWLSDGNKRWPVLWGGGTHIHPICLHRCSFTSTFIFTEHVLLYIFNRLLDTCYLCTVLLLYMPKKDQNTPTLQLQYLPLYKNTVLYLVSISLRCSKLIVRSLCHKHRGGQNTAEADSAMFMTSRSQILKDHIKYILTVSKIVHYLIKSYFQFASSSFQVQ